MKEALKKVCERLGTTLMTQATMTEITNSGRRICKKKVPKGLDYDKSLELLETLWRISELEKK